MSSSTYTGTCHCGAVEFRCELDDAQPTSRCNCSICIKTRLWKSPAIPASSFTLLRGADAMTEYRFATRRIAHMFCRTCGMKLFGHASAADFPNEFYVVNIGVLDGLSDEQLAALPLEYQNGRNDDWQSAPAHTSFL